MKKLVTLLLLICSITSYAQKDFKEGYIITLKKDTIKGFIREQSDVGAISTCHFKSSRDDSIQTYRVGFLTGYGFTKNNKNYVNHKIEFASGGTHRGYFERLASGKVSLYYYINEIDGNVTYYLFEKEGEEPVYITNKRSEIPKSEMANGLYYKKTLKELFSDCPSLEEDINKSSFKKSSFAKIAKRYNTLMETIENISFNFQE